MGGILSIAPTQSIQNGCARNLAVEIGGKEQDHQLLHPQAPASMQLAV